ncbi:TIGR03086 family metal-binding protein [Actinoplanes missouriensis]|uniref:TIGR03086 family metal-binding protein n=1 Tax=Actinoplanes missouriensis TaxID=1866 RepID=UPI0033FC8FE2
MSTQISDLLDMAAPVVSPVVHGVHDEQLPAATPCAEFTVHALLGHLLQVTANFQALARHAAADWSPGPDRVTGDWRDGFDRELVALREAWSAPEAVEGVSAGMGLPQHTVGMMLVADLVVHGWDLASATGQSLRVPGPLLTATGEFVEQMADTGRAMGAFGPAVAPPDDADEWERLLAMTGRDPRWRSGSRSASGSHPAPRR